MRIGFIDYYLDEWHANNYPAWIQAASGGAMRVTHAYAKLPAPPGGGRDTATWCREMGITHCMTITELEMHVDALVVLAPDNPEVHEELCKRALEFGKPTYIDKTFAPDGRAARRIFALAQKHGTPCYSTSALRYAAEYQNLNPKEVESIIFWGPGKLDGYAVHMLEPLMMLMQSPVDAAKYEAKGEGYEYTMRLRDGRFTMIAGETPESPYTARVNYAEESKFLRVESDFFQAFIADMVRFFETKTPPVPHKETLLIIDAIDVGKRARDAAGEWIEA